MSERHVAHHALEEGFLLAGRYRVLERVGTGGMGSVYCAEDQLHGTQVALKVLHKQHAADKVYVRRFIQEAELMNRVRHPNVVQTLDVGTHAGLIYLTMELVRGRTVEELIDSGTFPQDSIVSFIQQLCNGLTAIHAQEIIHRDLKPGNILVLDDGSIKITDFGVARPRSSTLTEKDQKVGSVFYMAPEIWLGKPLTSSVDLYAMGVLLYEITTGRLPFNEEAYSELMMRHLKRSVTPPREHNPELDPWLNVLIVKLLEKSPRDRFRSAEEVSRFVLSRSQQNKVFERPEPAVDSNSKSFPAAKALRSHAQGHTFLFKLSATQVMAEAQSAQGHSPRRKATVMFKLPRRAALVLEIESPSRDFLYLGLFFASLQILDGVLTSEGIRRFGVLKEGNPLLRTLMERFSPDQTLLLAKGSAIFVVAVLTIMAKRTRWVRDLIGVLSCIYLFAAIIPWIYILYVRQSM